MMKKWISLLCTMALLLNMTTAAAVSGGGTFKKYTFSDTPQSKTSAVESKDGYSFTGHYSLAMNMDVDGLWKSSSSAAFGAVIVMMDILAEEITGIDFEEISDAYLAKMSIQGEGEILAYYFFEKDHFVCALFNPRTGQITVSKIESEMTPKNAMYTMKQGKVFDDYMIVDVNDIEEIIKELLG